MWLKTLVRLRTVGLIQASAYKRAGVMFLNRASILARGEVSAVCSIIRLGRKGLVDIDIIS
jgi:hypothetical protein